MKQMPIRRKPKLIVKPVPEANTAGVTLDRIFEYLRVKEFDIAIVIGA
jgi:hypothetical protein